MATHRRNYYLQSLKRMSDRIPNEEQTVELAKTRLQQLESTWEKLEALHLELLERGGADENYIIVAEPMYVNCKASLLRTISQLQNPVPNNVTATQSPVSESELEIGMIGMKSELLNEIRTFNGDFAKWTEFRNRFESAVHMESTLKNEQKLHLLKMAVTERAARVLGNWPLTDTNYILAWKKLCRFYDNPYEIARAHIHSLLTMPRVVMATFDSIFDLIDTVTYAQNKLTVMDVPAGQWDLIIIYLIEERLDDCSRHAWIDYRKYKQIFLPKWNDMLDFLQVRALMTVPAHRPVTSTMTLPPTTDVVSRDVLDELPRASTSQQSVAGRSEVRDEHIQRPKRKLSNSTPRSRSPPPYAKKELKKLAQPANKTTFQPKLIGHRRRNTVCGGASVRHMEVDGNDCIVCHEMRTSRFVNCKDCNDRVHLSCLREQSMMCQQVEENWRCSKCLKCSRCSRPQESGSKLLKCKICDNRFHLKCQKQPVMVQKNTFKCDNCK